MRKMALGFFGYRDCAPYLEAYFEGNLWTPGLYSGLELLLKYIQSEFWSQILIFLVYSLFHIWTSPVSLVSCEHPHVSASWVHHCGTQASPDSLGVQLSVALTVAQKLGGWWHGGWGSPWNTATDSGVKHGCSSDYVTYGYLPLWQVRYFQIYAILRNGCQ
jgi:hypothetical protein